ncbi:MAG: DUF4124 domain-containing protein [Candidatus Riflebacteria bacterium]|nr:DUF4124 domain-containing protein [Candidatus Riflebacteria bacterium]
MNRRLTLALTLFGLLLWNGAPVWSEEPAMVYVYKAVKDYGRQADLKKTLGSGDAIEEAEDGRNGYVIRRVEIRSEGHLLSLMGVGSEAELSDTQKGLLEVYRMGTSGTLADLNRFGPSNGRSITVNLVDVTGCDDRQKFPAVREDYWPKASKSTTTKGNKTTTAIDITISGVDSQGYGARTAREMKATFAHEFGHTLDQAQMEWGAYGPDGHHWQNEVIGERAAFKEGFANFVQLLAFPERARDYRASLFHVQYETASRTYNRFPPDDAQVKPTDLLRVEAVTTLLLWRFAQELGDGREKVMRAFQESNSYNNSLGRFLQTLVRQNPGDAAAIAKILDEETRKRMSNEEIRTLFGNDPGIESFLSGRTDPGARRVVSPPPADPAAVIRADQPPVSQPPPTAKVRIYKWKDKDGRLHFTDVPPPPDVPYTMMAPQPVPTVRSSGDNPFADE